MRTRPSCSRATCSETHIYIPSCLSTSSGGLVASGKLIPHTLGTSFKCVCRRSGGPGGGEGGLTAARRGGGGLSERQGSSGPASRPGRHAGRAAQVGGELKAEQRNVHTLAGKPAGEVSESQRGGALGTRAGRARARARGGRGRRRAAGAAGGEPRAGNIPPATGSPPPSPRPPALPGAPPSPTPERWPRRASPGPGAWADPHVPAGSLRPRTAPRICKPRSRGRADRPEQPRPPSRSCSRDPRDSSPAGAQAAGGGRQGGGRGAGARARAPGILGGEVAGLWPVPFRRLKPALGAPGA